MNKYIIVIILLLTPLCTYAQESNSLEKYITGRWIEITRIEGEISTPITEYQDTYIFRKNKLFHKGESSEGIILFNITGKFSVENNIVSIIYKDYTNKETSSGKAKEVVFEILSINKDKKEMLVLVKDYDYEYQMILKKQYSE